jgi:hypothetical protein
LCVDTQSYAPAPEAGPDQCGGDDDTGRDPQAHRYPVIDRHGHHDDGAKRPAEEKQHERIPAGECGSAMVVTPPMSAEVMAHLKPCRAMLAITGGF